MATRKAGIIRYHYYIESSDNVKCTVVELHYFHLDKLFYVLLK